MSETGDALTIHQALAAAKAAIGAVKKTGRNQQQNYNFRGIDAVVNAAAPELNKQGVIVAPMLQSIEYDTVEVGQKRTPMAHVRVIVTYRFHGPGGDYLDAMVPGESMDSGDKAAPKAMSVAYRIALLQALNLPTDEPDPDSQIYERSPRQSTSNSGHPNGQTVRPAGSSATAEPPGPKELDPDAQPYADEAFEARTLAALKDVNTRAREAHKLAALIKDPGDGTTGGLGRYIGYRKRQLEEVDSALRALHEAAGKARMDLTEADIHVKKVTGKDIESASAAELRQAAEALLAVPA